MKHVQSIALTLKDLQTGKTYFSRKMSTNFVFIEKDEKLKEVKISKDGSKIEHVSYPKFFNAYMKEGIVED